jgi:biopolymer transport protein TolR
MAFAASSATGPRAQINMTPMIDVLLVLLIIFMVITPTQSVSIPTLVPQPPTSQVAAPDPNHFLVLVIDERKDIFLNTQHTLAKDLPNRLLKIFGAAPNRTLFVKAHGNLDYQTVAQVMDIAQGAGVRKIALATSD